MQGIQRVSKPPAQKEPITPRILQHLRRLCNFNIAHDRVLWGVALLGYLFLLRRGEYLKDKGQVKPYILLHSDVKCLTSRGRQAHHGYEATSVCVTFRGGKTYQSGKVETRVLEKSGSWRACPVRAAWLLSTHQRQNKIPSDQSLCTGMGHKRITASDMTRAIKEAAHTAGQNPARFSTHSMRSGRATTLFTARVDRLAIKRFGRWRSDAFELYTRFDGQTVSGLAENMMPTTASCHRRC